MKIITILVFIASLLLYSSVFISPEVFSYIGLLPFFIPITLIINGFLLAILTLAWRRLAFLPLISLVIGYKFILITFQIHSRNEAAPGLKVLTYNTAGFNYKRGQEPNVFTWLADHTADVKVFQEFNQDYTSSTRNAVKQFSKDGEYEYFHHVIEGNANKRSRGLVIFSRYPIVNDGIVFDNNETNGAIFADIQVGNDTLRIYNAHLQSMAITPGTLNDYDRAEEVYRQTLGKLH